VSVEHHPAEDPREVSSGGRSFLGSLGKRIQAGFALHFAALHEVVAISAAVRDPLRRWYRLPRRKGKVIPHGIDVETFRFDPAGRRRIRARLGLAEDVFLIGSLGRLSEEKGFDRLLPVIANIAADPGLAHVMLAIAGVGHEAERLKSDAERLGIADRVIFTGWLDDEDRVPFLSALDCFVVPSRVEGQGLALIQAMACERPSVATDCGGVADVLTKPDIGWLTPTDDFDAFGRALQAVVALAPDARAAVGRRARTHVEEHFEVTRQADQIVDALLGPFAASRSTPG
jgi:glycosyltransferase involved in cell wall biosynthesis